MTPPHWGPRTRRQQLDEFVADLKRPQAFPAEHAVDLMGRIRVRLCAGDHTLVAHGFGGQRIEIPASSVGAVRTVDSYQLGLVGHSQALLVLDENDRVLLRASGLWETYGEVRRVCRAAHLPAPSHQSSRYRSAAKATNARGAKIRARRRTRSVTVVYRKAPGYRKLRTAPRGNAVLVLVRLALALALIGLTAFVGVMPAVLLPEWIGAVRTLIGIAGVLVGVVVGRWLCAVAAHAITDGLRWAIMSLESRAWAPAKRFFGRRKEPVKREGLVTAVMMLGVPALVIWGPGVAIASAVHGVSDSHLVAELRAEGASAPGVLVDVPKVSTDSDGHSTVTNVPTLLFGVAGHVWQVADPAIGGRPLPLDSAHPASTREPVTVVYLRDRPSTAATARQVSGSVWHGAPMANEIVGSIFTLALPLLLWRTVRRIRRRKWLRDADLLDDLATSE
ncbi:MAG: hypothetical protein J2P25_19055 [Nocardiopsaceae bacterium]|nr:hypothetical protein [Nocardiopsaceae bacterium]